MRTKSYEPLFAICMIAATFVGSAGAQGGNATFAEKLGIPFANSRVCANGISLEYESFGGPDREVVLLVMGTGGQLTQWPETLCQQLVQRGYRVVTFDNRDCGHSTRFDAAGVPDWPVIFSALASGTTPPLAYTLDDMAKDVVGLLDGLGIKRAHVVGISTGGSIAQVMAAQYQVPPIVKSGDIDAIILREVILWQTIASPAYPTSEPLIRKRVESYVRRAYYPAGIERQGAASLRGLSGMVNRGHVRSADKVRRSHVPDFCAS
jgi:pimeloyl-ACP methyl ester carboxylesterase